MCAWLLMGIPYVKESFTVETILVGQLGHFETNARVVLLALHSAYVDFYASKSASDAEISLQFFS